MSSLTTGVSHFIRIVCLGLLVLPLKGSQTVPTGGTSLFTGNPPAAFSVRAADTSSARLSTVSVTGQAFSQAWKLETLKDVSTKWNIELAAKINTPVVKDGVGLLHFWARATTITDTSAVGHMFLVVQKGAANYDKSLATDINLSGQWAEYFVPFQMIASYGANASEICIDVGFKRQTLEIGGFEAIYYGTSLTIADLPITHLTYPGQEPDSTWRAAALARIELNRKGNFTIHVTDAEGNPVKDAAVHVAMTKHAFQFGTAIPFVRLQQDSPENRIFQQKFNLLFNAASPENDFKWPPWEGDWGPDLNHDRSLFGINWLHDRGVFTRGHVFVWPGWTNLPNSVVSLRGTSNQDKIPKMVIDHINDVASVSKGLITEWDVINEPYDNHALMDLFGPSIMTDWFKAARNALPDDELYLNDWNNHDDQADPEHVQVDEDWIKYLQTNGAPITGLGIQAHIGGSPNAPVNVLATFDRLAALGVKLRITEFDINTKDTALQADYTRDFLIACFSHPAVVGFQFWGFWEGAHWIPDGALYETDFTEKPNGAAYRSLVLDQWWTSIDGSSDANGDLSGRGFFGDYTVSMTINGTFTEKTFSIKPGAPAPNITISPVAPRLYNLSTRSLVGGKAGPAIVGLVIEGTEPKRILVRAVGPTLSAFGVPNSLSHPTLTLFNQAGAALEANTGWDSGTNSALLRQTFAEAGAFSLSDSSGDSAIVITLAPGNYTAVATAPTGESGVTLIEAYEVGAGNARLVNLSNRSFVGTGANVAISGITIQGTNARTFLIRAIGPSLAPFGVTNLLARPSISINRGQIPFAGNAIWSTNGDPSAIQTAMNHAGAFSIAPDSTDAAMLVTLEPGAYTVITSGGDGGVGNCLVEVYEVTQ